MTWQVIAERPEGPLGKWPIELAGVIEAARAAYDAGKIDMAHRHVAGGVQLVTRELKVRDVPQHYFYPPRDALWIASERNAAAKRDAALNG